ncbi:hypothetical protein FoTM2_011869 [Fusarium oxysporum f. sp. vasinfectum]|uniref:Uncharacterized protein n=2 Tax=Fusarium oxysporum TaxID=5507 RepID=N4TKM5_FUSC1|nr:hypothetical protein FOC1_g10000827 [Fusarium oxysporum f. sp. cubense race 1]EXM26047.1 hypothetical protein FOTG_07706 [Fusarium oxysporum f. sp. vasinfectum 25433]KAK2929005.1 hypothetical protein FoTM2_011869 [Fusarium oxysporum f. sp. vasinfectum]
MYTRAFLSLAVGLVGVAASPCKPLTSASIVTSATVTSSVAEPTVSTSVKSAETSTSAESLVTVSLTSTTALTTTSADSTTLFTTETSAATTDFSSTETSADTTTADATTTTSDAPAEITTFSIIAGSGPAADNNLRSDNNFGTPLYFGSRVTLPAQHYNIDAATGQIKAGTKSICAWFQNSDTTKAYITACTSDNENPNKGVVFLNCQVPTEGSALQCSVPVLSCIQQGGGEQTCAATTDTLSHFSMEGDDRMVYIVGDGFTGINHTPVDLVIDQAAVAAPTA